MSGPWAGLKVQADGMAATRNAGEHSLDHSPSGGSTAAEMAAARHSTAEVVMMETVLGVFMGAPIVPAVGRHYHQCTPRRSTV